MSWYNLLHPVIVHPRKTLVIGWVRAVEEK